MAADERGVQLVCNGGVLIDVRPDQAAMFRMIRDLLADCEGPLAPIPTGSDEDLVRLALRWADRPCPQAAATLCGTNLARCYRVLALAHYLCAPLPDAPPEAHLFYHHVMLHIRTLFRGKAGPDIVAMHRVPASVLAESAAAAAAAAQ